LCSEMCGGSATVAVGERRQRNMADSITVHPDDHPDDQRSVGLDHVQTRLLQHPSSRHRAVKFTELHGPASWVKR
jgi:hypothetical protein